VKGLGEDIFFGQQPDDGAVVDRSADQTPTSVSPEVQTPESPQAPLDDSQDVLVAGRPDALAAGRPDVATSGVEEETFFGELQLPASLRRRLRSVLRDDRRIHTTVRFGPDEMAALRDLVYQMDAKMGVKVTRNEVMRIALHFFLRDYELRKKGSLLLQILEEIDD
jgi:hypothetical protein